jgi:SAM-dependent methyltransferase
VTAPGAPAIPAVPAPKRAGFAVARLLLRSVGRLSDGLSLCFEEGLTSGLMLEYIYRDRPSGRLGIGRWIDAQFIRAPGWNAVRERRRLLEGLIERAVRSLREAGRSVTLVDVASGPAGYVLAVLGRTGEQDVTATCRDLDERWLETGRQNAAAAGLRHVRFEKGDALDRGSLLALRPRPNLVVASGFYDWIVDDAAVRESIGIVFDALEPGGIFTLTHQAANPDLAFLNAVFTDFHHAPLQMKMRPPELVRGWLESAGFRVEDALTDTRHCYGVVSARRP